MAATSISRTRKQEQSALACVCVCFPPADKAFPRKLLKHVQQHPLPRSDPKKGYTVCIRHSLSIKTAPQFHSDWPAFKIREPQTPDQLPHSKQSSRTSNVFTSSLTQKQPNSSKLKLQQPYLWCLQSAPCLRDKFPGHGHQLRYCPWGFLFSALQFLSSRALYPTANLAATSKHDQTWAKL